MASLTPTTPAVAADDGHDVAVMAKSLPEDDGMRSLRQRIHEIREMKTSNEEKARKMHSVMTEKYNAAHAHVLRPLSPLSIFSPERPLTPTSSQSQSECDTHLATPLSQRSLYDPENPFNVSPEDRLPTYYTKPVATEGHDCDDYEQEEEPSFGCEHYKRNVKVQCYDCRRWYTCRHCHNEVEDHALNRRKTENMLCMFCRTPQPAADECKACGETAAWYYCDICKLWDDDSNMNIYHCDDCGICRKGEGLGKDFFHCKKCNVCIAIKFAEDHRCLEGATERDCPICGEYLHTSTTPVVALHCGHYLHQPCYRSYINTAYKCPVCKKSAVNMELNWRKLTHDIESQPMPSQFADTKVYIQCNDCSAKGSVKYHFLGNKCNTCDSYNTNELHFIAEPDLIQTLQAMQEMELAQQANSECLPLRPVRSNDDPPRAARLRSGGSYFQTDRELAGDIQPATRPGTATSALDQFSLSPQDLFSRFSRSLSPIRHYLNGSNEILKSFRDSAGETPNDTRSRVREGDQNEELDFWGEDGRILSGEEDEIEDDGSDSDTLDEIDDLEEEDGDDEPDLLELPGHR